MKVFLSHASEEAREAQALKHSLEAAVPGAQVFVSAADIRLGDAWLRQIDEALVDTRMVLVLCSPNSVRRPWLNFEGGSGWSRRLPVVPICYKGMRKDRLPDPFGIFQAVELSSATACRALVDQLASVLGCSVSPDFEPARMLAALQVELPPRTHDVGIVLAQRQGEWETGARSVFVLPKPLPQELQERWSFRVLDDERQFLMPDLHELSGLILAMPWRARLTPEAMAATVEWVRAGGRLLLLGFQLGDRHHDSNLSQLAHQFGIDPASDIVGPAGYGPGKPYEVPLDFDPSQADEHPFTEGLASIRLANLQTLRVDPGGTEWLRVGTHVVYRPRRDTVVYRDGTMTVPGGDAYDINSGAGWMPVAVEAPPGLCGAGGVHMIGTWDLLGRTRPFEGENPTLLTRLLDWLSRRT